MSLLDEYLCGAVDLTLLMRDARDKVQWAAIPIRPGEKVKAQIFRAHEELKLSHELVRAAWYEQIGPYQWPPIHNAWLELAKRRAGLFEQFATAAQRAYLAYVNELPVPIRTRAAYSALRVTAFTREPRRRRRRS